MTRPTHARATTSECCISWPQDDSYRGHVDRAWLRVLAARVKRPVASVWSVRRHFVLLEA